MTFYNIYVYIYIIKCHKMSFYNIYVYVVTILVSRSCYAFMTTSRTMQTLLNVTERYRIRGVTTVLRH